MINQNCYRLGSEPSVIRALFDYGLKKKAEEGEDRVYDYSLGNPSIPAPEKVNQTIVRLVKETDPLALHGYSMAAGFADARKVVAENLSSRFGLAVSPGELFFTCGAAPALVSALWALTVSPDTEFIVAAPYFPEYKVFAEGAGGKLIVLPPDTENFQIDLPALAAAINQNTQAIIVNSPNNPSGVVYTEETIRKIADILGEKEKEVGHPIYIIADEPYRELVYGGVKVPFIPNIYKNSIVCYSWSKSLSLPGERIGYVYIPGFAADAEELYKAVAGAARAGGHVCPPSLIQRVIGQVVSEMPDLEAYDKNRELLYTSLTKMGYHCVKPDGAFYLFVKAPNGDANRYSEMAKLNHNLLVVPGDGFGCPGYFRLSYCVSYDMIQRSLPAFEAMIKEIGSGEDA